MTESAGKDCLFSHDRPGRRGYLFPPAAVPYVPAGGHRAAPPELPELTELDSVRHFTRLSQRNLCVETTPLPLGPLSMDYAPRSDARAASHWGLGDVHPATPVELCQGSLEVIHRFQDALCRLFGMDACSSQTGTPEQALFASLAGVKAFFEDHGGSRRYVLVPDTIPFAVTFATRQAGFQTISLPVGADGAISLGIVNEAIEEYGRDIAALVVATPNGLGHFQPELPEIAELVHSIGAQIHLDGSQFPGLTGIVRPRELGVDAIHVDLAAFGVPRGSGGPWGSALAVRSHLEPYLPNPRVLLVDGKYSFQSGADSIGPVGDGIGTFPLIARAFAFVLSQGAAGLRQRALRAVLNANYLKACLKDIAPSVSPEPTLGLFAFGGPIGTEAAMNRVLLSRGFHPFVRCLPERHALIAEPTEGETSETLDRLADALKVAIQAGEQESPESNKENIGFPGSKTAMAGVAAGKDGRRIFSVDDRR